MNTRFSEVFSLFLGSIEDGDLAMVSAEELENVLIRYLVNATTSLVESDIEVNDIDFENKHFGTQLNFENRSIVAKAMKLEWVREKLYSGDLMRKAVGDRDFSAVQGDKYLKELRATSNELEREIRSYINQLSFKGFGGF